VELEHHFTVPASVEETWAAFNDPERVAPCFPGATLTSVDGDEFTGSAKIKLGPIALQYNGVGTYIERDQSAHRAVIEAKGKDKRGNGTANATVTAELIADDGGTAVHVTTDLAVTGKPAQFGRGVMQDVSDKLLGQFVACLQTKLGASEVTGAAPTATGITAPTGTASVATPSGSATGGAAAPRTQASAYRPAQPSAPAPEVELNLLRTIGRVLLTRYAARVLGPLAFLAGYLLGRRSRR
jgi:carbon monoxide dehydrogenase subunit G